MNSVPSYTRGRKSAIAKRAIKGFATHALKTIPSLAVGACVGASFPQSALAFTASDYISNAINTRNTIIGVSVAAATSAQIIRISRNGSMAIASSATSEDAVTKETITSNSKKPSKIPITVLSGFLGAGKTTALKRLLENTEGIRVGTIVNDVAAVNIDAKLISNPMNNHNNGQNSNAVGKGSSGGTVELQNGCACCSLSDELLTSVSDLMEGRDLDALVVELSGVADPAAVRQNWKQAVEAKHPATLLADLSRVVTVVDSHTFGTDWMTWDTAGKRDWAEEGDICAGSRQVPELLAEQVEAADVIILNKVDLSKGEQLETAKIVSRSLNKDAEMIETSFGELEPISIIGDISALRERDEGHSHDHSSHNDASNCSDPDCTDTSHNHSHDHSSHEDSCSDPGCSDASHNHDHSSEACSDPDCNDSSHSHSHSHSSEACTDPDCNDASHDHSHDHKAATTSTDNLGISNFVYKSSRPFDARKLQRVLMSWPIPVMEELNLVKLGKELEEVVDTDAKSPFSNLLRSKGFVWVAPSHLSPDDPLNDLDRHDVALYWSHAGKHFGLKEAGMYKTCQSIITYSTLYEYL